MSDYGEEIDLAVDYYKSIMPEKIKDLIRLANLDLWHGPLYVNKAGELVECFDVDACPVSFSETCAEINDWITDHVQDIEMEVDWDEVNEVSVMEPVEGSARDIIGALVGKELVSYV